MPCGWHFVRQITPERIAEAIQLAETTPLARAEDSEAHASASDNPR
jgi:hypothetical protein